MSGPPTKRKRSSSKSSKSKKNTQRITTVPEPQSATVGVEILKAVKKLGVVKKEDVEKGNIVAVDEEDEEEIEAEDLFWEVETVMGKRTRSGKVEYLVKWRGYDICDNTWEPQANLSDSALRVAQKFSRKKKEEREISEREVRRLGLTMNFNNSVNNSANNSDVPSHVTSNVTVSPSTLSTQTQSFPDLPPPPIFASSTPPPTSLRTPSDLSITINWTDSISYMNVKRVNINDPDSTRVITQMRREGIPVILTEHEGWADFAKPWLVKEKNGEKNCVKLNVARMGEDVGEELVPVVKKNYNAGAPICGNVMAKTFLEGYWGKSSELYLHQWQFTLSMEAGAKMCNKNTPLPFFGIDLLSSWLDLPQCKNDNPLQYLFMGSSGTFSRLHQDNGGLCITISPIVGEKEAVMVHRDDHMCLYHGEVNVNEPDFHRFPMLANARVWKTTVGPGEILLMPEGTYHQCRNKTDCLSYSRFHLDTLNLPSFIQSLLDNDAPEIDHATILWNACKDLMDTNDALIDRATEARKQKKPCPPTTEADLKVVETLQTLRHSCRELAMRCSLSQSVIANSISSEAFNWEHCYEDIDLGLHEFRYRNLAKLPKMVKRDERSGQQVATKVSLAAAPPVPDDNGPPLIADTHVDMSEFEPVAAAASSAPEVDTSSRDLTIPVSDFKTFLRNNPKAQQEANRQEVCAVTKLDLKEGDIVTIVHQNRLMQCTILRSIRGTQGAFVSFDGFGQEYDELHPLDLLKDTLGNGRREIDAKNVKVGDFVYARWGALKDVYRAQINELFQGAMVRVHFHTFIGGGNEWDQWIPGNKVIAVLERAEDVRVQREAREESGGRREEKEVEDAAKLKDA